MNELQEVSLRHELQKAHNNLHSQTLLIVVGAIIAAFFGGYIYHDVKKA